MNTGEILQRFGDSTPFQSVLRNLQSGKNIDLKGVCGSSPAFVAACVYLAEKKPLVVILPNRETALYFKNDLENLLAGEQILFLPHSFAKSFQIHTENALQIQERIECINLLRKNNQKIIVSYAEAIAELIIEPSALQENTYEISVGQNLDLEFLMDFLQENGFEKTDFVFEPGQFAVRGGIVDLFSFAHENPFRIELDGREIESIRSFDVNSQLSLKDIAFFSLVAKINTESNKNKLSSIFQYFHAQSIYFVEEIKLQIDFLTENFTHLLQEHTSAQDLRQKKPPEHPKEIFLTPGEFVKQIEANLSVHFGSSKIENAQIIEFQHQPQPHFHRNFDLVKEWLKQNKENNILTLFFSDQSKQVERLYTILSDLNIENSFEPVYTGIGQGFIDYDNKIALTTEHQLFEKYYKPRSRQRYSSNTALSLRELKNLQPGDFVTHIDHGIGRFAGLEKMEQNGVLQEVVRIVYKDNDLLYVSVNSLHKISKYSSKDGTEPSLHKLGSPQWEKQKKSTKKRVKDIARELIALYAKRKSKKGYSFAPDNYLQIELEAGFFYEDTPDQAKAVEDVKRDMESTQPMDRLVCGDVGFGKTEVAMRAAFKAVCDSKQVAVLVPTTILAQQHYRTFSKRFKGFPVNVEYLNRFKTSSEQKKTLEKLESGKVDVIIGTHRLLGKDLKFKDLGLLIIDEEQKFGVSAKEKLKEIRVNVDTLTLTATPIPRTLHFSLMGARDLSIINTPPPNRQPVHTELQVFNKQNIAEAIEYEVKRGGQVFFIHSRVKDIYGIQAIIHEICPGVKCCVAHGQMEGTELEDAMVKFVEGEYDVLIATSIIESGLDIPNANTIIINNAHYFGLSDLHQMRGRVGRSNVKAFCYLLSPPLSSLTDVAKKRLRTIEEYNELGGGFQVAMRDLDIRGAGNLLGGEQSGFISEMGFDMYQKILDEAVQELKQEEFADIYSIENTQIKSRDCAVETEDELLIPSNYVSSVSERLSLYNELSNIENEKQIEQFMSNLEDRFGSVPYQVKNLLSSLKLRWLGKEIGTEKITINNERMRLYLPGEQSAAIYQSDFFIQLMQHISSFPNKFSLKQTGKALIINIQPVSSIDMAINELQELNQLTTTLETLENNP